MWRAATNRQAKKSTFAYSTHNVACAANFAIRRVDGGVCHNLAMAVLF
jgi:hypothetical protein